MKDLAKCSLTWNYWNLEAGCYYFLNHPQHHRHSHEKKKERKTGSIYVSGKLPTYPSPKLTLTLNSQLRQNDGLGEGQVGSFPKTLIDPKNKQQTINYSH